MTSFKYQSLQDIVYKNSDYLLDTIENHMRYLESFPNTPNVFEGILNITGFGILPFLSQTVKMMLQSLDIAATDQQQRSNVQIYVKILLKIIIVLHKNAKHQIQYQSKLNNLRKQIIDNQKQKEQVMDQQQDDGDDENRSIDDIKTFFLNHHTTQKDKQDKRHITTNPSNLDDNDDEDQGFPTTADGTIPSPSDLGIPDFQETTELSRQLVQDILEKSIHFVSSKNRNLKLDIIDIIDKSLTIISTGNRKYGSQEIEDDNDQQQNIDDQPEQPEQPNKSYGLKNTKPKIALYPMIHLVWPSIVKRVSEPDRVVCKRALKVIITISHLSTDFISQRFWEQLWPILSNILIEENVLLNSQKDTFTTEKRHQHQKNTFTPSFKIQNSILSTLATVLLTCTISQDQLLQVARDTLVYLDSHQPEPFQQYTRDIWKTLLAHDPDALFLLLFTLSHLSNQNSIYQLPSSNSSLIDIPNFKITSNDFKSNALLLFQQINS